MDFNEFRSFIRSIEVPKQRMGVFNLEIIHEGEKYHFYNLKENCGYNDDLFGFGLNHHFENCAEQPTKNSIFHDSEDVSVDIWRNDFVSAEKKSENKVHLKMKDWGAMITFNEDE